MGNNSVPKFIFRLSRFPVYRGSVLGRFYCSTSNYTPPDPGRLLNEASANIGERQMTISIRGLKTTKIPQTLPYLRPNGPGTLHLPALTLTPDSRNSACLPLASVDILCETSGLRRGAVAVVVLLGLSQGVGWQFVTAGSGKRIVPTFTAQDVHKSCNNLHHATWQNRGNLCISYCSDVCWVPTGGRGYERGTFGSCCRLWVDIAENCNYVALHVESPDTTMTHQAPQRISRHHNDSSGTTANL